MLQAYTILTYSTFMWLSQLHFHVSNQNAVLLLPDNTQYTMNSKGFSFYVNVCVLSTSKVAILKAIFNVFRGQSNNFLKKN